MLVSDILLSITLFQIFLRRLFWVFLCELLRNPLRIFLFDLFNCLKSSLLGDLRLLVHSTLGFKLIRSFLFFCLFVVAGWRLDIHFLLAFFKMLIFFFLLILGRGRSALIVFVIHIVFLIRSVADVNRRRCFFGSCLSLRNSRSNYGFLLDLGNFLRQCFLFVA